ncbi:hypothetical protein FRB91_003307 [Serendipita sp. 411]|nr:hypothetical protein FRB91_003307 [Serendipita sp. 411]KAG8871666.1 hypothetical protein FRC20_010288 [Serendipita sp. 405]
MPCVLPKSQAVVQKFESKAARYITHQVVITTLEGLFHQDALLSRIKLIIILFLALDGAVVVVRGDGPSCTWVDSNRYKILVKDEVSSGGERKEPIKSAFTFLSTQL